MIIRPHYMKILKTYRDIPLVKILAGMRHFGKSTISEMLRNDLKNSGVSNDCIIFTRYTSEELDEGMTDKDMYRAIKEKITDSGKRYYILLDEVQEINDWEKAVNSLLENANTDIYVTGSNSKLMSSEISTYLSGRYISIPVFTLSFAEYLDFKKSGSPTKELLNEYIRTGGFPIIALGNFDDRSAYQIAEGIYTSVITNDIARRHNIANFDLFNRVVKYVVENVGKQFSANAVVKFLKNEGRSVSVEAVYNYLEWLEKAFVIYRCRRYDLQGKSMLKTQKIWRALRLSIA